MAEQEVLEKLFESASAASLAHLKPELTYRHMMALATIFEGWSLSRHVKPEQSAHLLGWAEALRQLADEVGPGWSPPEPPTVGIMGYLGRLAFGEMSPPLSNPV
jgi:hypothetical protein